MRKHQVIGVMSGSSLDGLDLTLSEFSLENSTWNHQIIKGITTPFPQSIASKLTTIRDSSALDLVILENEFTAFVSEAILDNFQEKEFELIGFHGHTVFHNPSEGYTFQIGNAAMLSAKTGKAVVADFRRADVSAGGQGAPLVPVGDVLLFPDYTGCLNLGGIANISIYNQQVGNLLVLGFDVAPCNQILNYYANQLGFPYDDGGKIAKGATINDSLLQFWNDNYWLTLPYPKSLGNEFVFAHFISNAPIVSPQEGLATGVRFIAEQIAKVINTNNIAGKILVTGGGALNLFLVAEIQARTPSVQIMVPNINMVQFKEAHIFAFLGLLRCLEMENTWASVTGAKTNLVSGGLHGINPYK